MFTRHLIVLWVVLAGSLTPGAFAHAEESPPPNIAVEQSEQEHLRERLTWIQRRFAEGETHAQWWYWGWLGQNAAAATAQGVIAGVTDDKELRIDMIIGGASAAIGVVSMAFFPLPARYAADELKPTLQETDTERLRQNLMQAEYWLQQSATSERLGRSWIAHLANFLIVAAGSGIMLGFEHYESAAINLGVGLAVGELLIWSQPTQAIDDWEMYKQRYCNAQDCTQQIPKTPRFMFR